MNIIMGYNITFSVDNNLLKLSNYGLNHLMKLTEEDGVTKYYNGLNLVSVKYELPENPHINSVSVCDKELKQYKITFELTNNNYFSIDIQCDNNYYLLNEPTNLINYLKNNHININDINELYNIIIKFINPNSCNIKITDKKENYLFYDHNILSDLKQTIITDNDQINIKKHLEDENYKGTNTTPENDSIKQINKPYIRKRK